MAFGRCYCLGRGRRRQRTAQGDGSSGVEGEPAPALPAGQLQDGRAGPASVEEGPLRGGPPPGAESQPRRASHRQLESPDRLPALQAEAQRGAEAVQRDEEAGSVARRAHVHHPLPRLRQLELPGASRVGGGQALPRHADERQGPAQHHPPQRRARDLRPRRRRRHHVQRPARRRRPPARRRLDLHHRPERAPPQHRDGASPRRRPPRRGGG
ncbi:hypothetical protein VTK73DRAFT_1090 [Phialemonium thermophilum]|uniref:Uncharacterized protein n=1 Tax=Phialemonium thermophilum TaxID=223376 RepID=A0ABR3VTY9_9PEZI